MFIMKKVLFILAVCVCGCVSAQNLQWEGVGGLNVSNLGGLGSKVGFHVGVKTEMALPSLSDGAYANVGALFSSKGSSQDYGDLGGSNISANYLDIPIHLGYKYVLNDKFSIYGEAGPYFAIGLFGNTKTVEAEMSENYELQQTSRKSDTFGEDGIKRFDLGLGLKVGVEFKKKYTLSIGYDWGLLDLYKKAGLNDENGSGDIDMTPKMKNKNLAISLGYKF